MSTPELREIIDRQSHRARGIAAVTVATLGLVGCSDKSGEPAALTQAPAEVADESPSTQAGNGPVIFPFITLEDLPAYTSVARPRSYLGSRGINCREPVPVTTYGSENKVTELKWLINSDPMLISGDNNIQGYPWMTLGEVRELDTSSHYEFNWMWKIHRDDETNTYLIQRTRALTDLPANFEYGRDMISPNPDQVMETIDELTLDEAKKGITYRMGGLLLKIYGTTAAEFWGTDFNNPELQTNQVLVAQLECNHTPQQPTARSIFPKNIK
jgi:hypothetical protein